MRQFELRVFLRMCSELSTLGRVGPKASAVVVLCLEAIASVLVWCKVAMGAPPGLAKRKGVEMIVLE